MEFYLRKSSPHFCNMAVLDKKTRLTISVYTVSVATRTVRM